MGVYFITAGSKSRSRDTLEHATELSVLVSLLSDDVLARLREGLGEHSLYVWGTMEAGRGELDHVQPGDYVVDVNGSEIVQVFEFVLACEPEGSAVQDALGWTKGGGKPFTHVFFLRRPRIPSEDRRDKIYFQKAFAFDKANWLSRSRYFDTSALDTAMKRCGVDAVEALLGIDVPREEAVRVTARLEENPAAVTREGKPAAAAREEKPAAATREEKPVVVVREEKPAAVHPEEKTAAVMRDESAAAAPRDRPATATRADNDTTSARAEEPRSRYAAPDSRRAKRAALLVEVRRDWRTAGVNLLDASTKLLELVTRALKNTDDRASRRRFKDSD
ncbi:MAG: hypothetical protein P8Y95_00260 [Gammaproteobacteria bacterium]